MRTLVPLLVLPLLLMTPTGRAAAEGTTLLRDLRHLRIEGAREWSAFPEQAEAASLTLQFDGTPNNRPASLRIRQQDVKQAWYVALNNQRLGRLPVDENDMVVYFEVPPGAIVAGKNVVRVEQDTRRRKTPDDVRIGEVVLDSRSVDEVLGAATVTVTVVDADTGDRLPSRITVLNEQDALQRVGAESNEHLAVRPGTVYTSDGLAQFGLPAGKYTVFAGRGFEYSIDQATIDVGAGKTTELTLRIRREVPTEGYVACDTHTHTLTHSGHGDATVQERMITLAAEGIELPIATDHNAHIDHEPFAREMHVRQYFTPVVGNEVTTKTGHFNIFPVADGAAVPGFKSDVWLETLDGIFATPGVRVAILNHARDVHGGTRPFGPKLFNDESGDNLEGWHMGFNAMEVINSGATQTDVMRLFNDWMTLLNRGYQVTPVGSSDSHDVARHFVGQGRTYIRCDDRDPGNIDIQQAVDRFLAGAVTVSYGLFTEIEVNSQYKSGDLAKVDAGAINVRVRVLGPHWVSADRVLLFNNGQLVHEQAIDTRDVATRPGKGIVWTGNLKLPPLRHDAHLVAIALGPGVDGLYWKTAKPYQPDSPDWTPRVIGCSGAVWVDGDGDAKRTSARGYAEQLVGDGDLRQLFRTLGDYDGAVAIQAASLLDSRGVSLLSDDAQRALTSAAPQTQHGFEKYLAARRKCLLARSDRP